MSRVAPVAPRAAAVLLALGMPAVVATQTPPPSEPDLLERPVRWEFALGLVVADPVGRFDEYVDVGGGFDLAAVWYLGERRAWGMRLDGTLALYGSTTQRRPLSPTVPGVEVDVKTENTIASFTVGPQVVFGGGPVRPFLHAGLGASQFATTTSVWGTDFSGIQPLVSSENFEDHVFRMTGAGGARIMLAARRQHPISLDVEARFVRHGTTEYLREGSIQELPGGAIAFEPIRSPTNLVQYSLLLTIGGREPAR